MLKASETTIQNALRCIEDARRALIAQYLSVEPNDPGYEVACAETLVPAHLRAPLDSLNAAAGHLSNVLDFSDRIETDVFGLPI